MLAAKAPAAEALRYPLYASPKIDGIRALIVGGRVLSRTLKPIPNEHVQALFGRPEYNGLDGELVAGDPWAENCMQATTSSVMRRGGVPDVTLYVFDYWDIPMSYSYRYSVLCERAGSLAANGRVYVLSQHTITSPKQLDEFERECLAGGYEGVMVRDPAAPYKFGRSGKVEGYLLKVKRFEDSEAEVIGMQELEHQDGSNGACLGALLVRDCESGVEFSIGTGFTSGQRELYWLEGEALHGRIVTYKHFAAAGVVTAPRFPVFKAFRDPIDFDGAPNA
jgi:DNA ligase 1